MKLTPRQRKFLQHAAVPGAVIKKARPFGRTPYWWVGEWRYELREGWGDALHRAGFIDRTKAGESYQITDAGRAAIAKPTDGTAVTQ